LFLFIFYFLTKKNRKNAKKCLPKGPAFRKHILAADECLTKAKAERGSRAPEAKPDKPTPD